MPPKVSKEVIAAIKTLKVKAPATKKTESKPTPEKAKQKKKIKKVIDEFIAGKLKSSNGDKVKNPKQALAIAIESAKRVK